jgi:hypothetical protein
VMVMVAVSRTKRGCEVKGGVERRTDTHTRAERVNANKRSDSSVRNRFRGLLAYWITTNVVCAYM